MKIHDLLDRDPRGARLANNGQARIDGDDDRGTRVLREELSTFVCDGKFGDALRRILDRYLSNLGSARQDAAWVSGFFGSGKSHLLKMVAHLWRNTEFADGATARSLAAASLPDDVVASLRELDTQAQRVGQTPVAAAGTLLGGNEWVRRTVLEIILRARGWPAQYAQARFCSWLLDEGRLDAVRGAVEAAGKDWHRELNNLYVSPFLAQAVIDAVPGFAGDVPGARQAIHSQFPPTRVDITTEEFVDIARRALSGGGELPHTVLVLDEVQQYIGDDEARSSAITELAEAVQTRFDGRVMLIGAGQSALSADTPYLAKLRDRFVIRVELTDADVEAVTRKVLLRKKPTAVPAIEKLFETHAGEVARHLQNTRIGARAEDERHRVEDYPLLPTRRRFWEACFPGGGRWRRAQSAPVAVADPPRLAGGCRRARAGGRDTRLRPLWCSGARHGQHGSAAGRTEHPDSATRQRPGARSAAARPLRSRVSDRKAAARSCRRPRSARDGCGHRRPDGERHRRRRLRFPRSRGRATRVSSPPTACS